ncbi:MAG: NAD(P)-dependent alcohol dehydrogenase [Gemmatimonadota bacterium]
MKAMVQHVYGSPDVIKLEEIPKPAPGDGDVLVKVHAASANAGDWRLMRADPFIIRPKFGLLKPKYKTLGADVAGRVEAVGRNVKQFRPGDDVFGNLSESGFGAFAEYVCVPEDALMVKPRNLSFEEAAAIPAAALTALQGVRDQGRIQPGQKILINGASGGVGTFAVQIAKSFGTEVTGVCSTRNLDLVRSIGADHVIDYTKGDFTKSAQRYDLIVAANGYHPIWDYRRALRPGGIYVMTGGSLAQALQAMLLGPWLSMVGGRKMGNSAMKPNQADLAYLKELIEAGKLKPVVDRRYRLTEVPEAIRYLEEQHARGKVVITV